MERKLHIRLPNYMELDTERGDVAVHSNKDRGQRNRELLSASVIKIILWKECTSERNVQDLLVSLSVQKQTSSDHNNLLIV